MDEQTDHAISHFCLRLIAMCAMCHSCLVNDDLEKIQKDLETWKKQQIEQPVEGNSTGRNDSETPNT